jgi:hypothetical protein
MICNPFYDQCVYDCIDQYMDDNLKGKNLNESKQFVLSCLKDIIDYDYSENDYKIVDMYNLKRYMLRHYSEEEIFKAMNGRQAAEAIEYFKDVEYIDDMTSDKITLDEMLAFYYMAHLYYNKKKIIKILIGYLQD